MISRRISLSLSAALLSLSAGGAFAQSNVPLTGSMPAPAAATNAAASGSAASNVPAPATAAPIPTVTAAPAAASPMPDRAVVRQVNTPMPVTGADTAAPPAGPAYAAPRPSATAAAPAEEGPTGAGGITRALMAAQADGRRAAPPQPMLGPIATASWQRYLNSFNQPIPQWFRERVDASGGSSSSGQ